jgi:GNAT superfamily N-acetyltransferase
MVPARPEVLAVAIRPATGADALAISQLVTELGYRAISAFAKERIEVLTGSSVDLLVVAVDSSGRVVGWLQAHSALVLESGLRVEILGMVVAGSARRRGVGRALVAHAEAWARSLSAESIVVRSNEQRVESHLFYPSLGYAATKTQRVYRKILKIASIPGS